MVNPSMLWKLARTSGEFLRPFSPQDCTDILKQGLQRREDNFLYLLEEAIYKNPNSPYNRLLTAAGIEFGDVSQLISEEGIEGTLQRLHREQIYITLEEFKGLRRLRRLGLDIPLEERDFDNPAAEYHFKSYTGGSTGARRRVLIDTEEWRRQAAAQFFSIKGYGVGSRPFGVWQPFCPGSVGFKNVFVYSKLGYPPERWFSQVPTGWTVGSFPYHAFRYFMKLAARRWGLSQPSLTHAPLDQAIVIARWMAENTGKGHPGYLDSTVSSGMRVCLAAEEEKLDISGTFFRMGSEPYTSAKAQHFANLGCGAATHYITSEAGAIGIACANRKAVDDVHLMSDSLAVLLKPKHFEGTRTTVDAFYLTSVRPSIPKLLLNVEFGDYGVMQKRRCGCPLGELGFDQHLHTIRSYEKLTSEGNHFLGKHLIELVEDVLPKSFGGGPTDYQLVERESGDLTRVYLLVHPRLGSLDKDQVAQLALNFLGSCGEGERLMSDIWRAGGTLKVERREPHATPGAKIMPLHALGGQSEVSESES